MKYYRLNKAGQFDGGPFTDLFILGTTRNAGGSDFTAAATTQVFTLLPVSFGDVVNYPLAEARVRHKFTDNATDGGAAVTLANLKCDVGHTDDDNAFIVGTNGDLIQAEGYPILSVGVAAAGGGTFGFTAASKNITATLTSSAGNISTITFGEIWIWLSLSRASVMDKLYAGGEFMSP